jgi:hypothetical protein
MERDLLFESLLDTVATQPTPSRITYEDIRRLRETFETHHLDAISYMANNQNQLIRPLPTPIIKYDEYNNRYIGQLGPIRCDYQLLGIEDFDERTYIQQRLRERLIQQAEVKNMAMGHGTTTTTTWATTAPTTASYSPRMPRPEDPVLMFNMKQNTHAVELRKLRCNYADAVFTYDFNIPIWQQFDHFKSTIRDYLHGIRRQIAAKNAYLAEIKPRNKSMLLDMFASSMSNRELDFIMDDNARIASTRAYMEFVNSCEEYRARRREFKRFQERYGEKQADHNRRAAMIRQKPELYITINRQSIVETIMTWDNVWAADTHVDSGSNTLYIRIGLCDIVMSESAQESYYCEPQDILLAPFYVTVKVSATGNAIVSSREGQLRGLSRGNPGQMSYDVHPHQLSDAPCFGTFGQTLIDLANNGDFISYIGTLIAFYSQYNSQDSVGVAARNYHPANFCIWEDEARYKFRLCENVRSYGKHLAINETKLDEAMERYKEYHQEENEQSPPEIQDYERCASCEDAPVGDNDTYYVTAYDSRVCSGCWEDHYCDTCERTNDDCECEPVEE